MQLFEHILVPTDGSELSRATAERAIVIAASMKARLTFFHAKPERRQSFFGGEGGAFVDQMPAEEFERLSEKMARDYLTTLEALAREAGVASACVIGSAGTPFEGIIDTANAGGCDLIIMASHGRKGIKRLLLGSETQHVLAQATVPVLVLR